MSNAEPLENRGGFRSSGGVNSSCHTSDNIYLYIFKFTIENSIFNKFIW